MRPSALSLMTDEERQLLENTARSLLRVMEEHKDAMAGMEAALLEVYRAQFTTDNRKHETMARLKLSLKVLEAEGRGANFLSEFIRKLEPWKS
jgi:predicted transcriptional regulator